jgi:hypothetical protein
MGQGVTSGGNKRAGTFGEFRQFACSITELSRLENAVRIHLHTTANAMTVLRVKVH